MSTRPELVAQSRSVQGKAVARLRREGILPAVVYGHGAASESLQLAARDFDDLRRHHGRNTLIDLTVDGGSARPVLVHSIQEHPLKRRPIHVDFYLVKMTEEITVDVPVVAVGSSHAVDKMGGNLLHNVATVKVRALPGDLPQTIEADISVLVDFEAVIHVGDLPMPERVQLVTDPGELALRVQPPRVEEEPEPVEAVEGEAPAEGTEAAPAEETETSEG
ncbi:MAG: 50S ribosomal protein L25 [Candidatus Limnocylindrales bacterium]